MQPFRPLSGGNKLQTTAKADETKPMETSKPTAPSLAALEPKNDVSESLSAAALAALQNDVQPVGHDYVEEVFILTVRRNY